MAGDGKRVVIVGGGFAGLNCALDLANDPDISITLLDKNNYQQFNPLFYQVAAGILSPGNAAFALRDVVRDLNNIDVQMAEVVSIDLANKSVTTKSGEVYGGDFVVLATGAAVNFFGTTGAEQHSYPLYSLKDAETLRAAILNAFELADVSPAHRTDGALNFVVVGGGPTGVETAGVLIDMVNRTISKEFRHIVPSMAQIFLVERNASVLSMFSPVSQSYAASELRSRGVQLHLGVAIREVDAEGVLLSNGMRIQSKTVIWAAGLTARTVTTVPQIVPGPRGRVEVNEDLSLLGFPEVYVLGDLSNAKGTDKQPLPQLAAVAKQEGQFCARSITGKIKGNRSLSFVYKDRGILAMIGPNAAVAELGSGHHEIIGPFAFVTWLGVHAALLTVNRARLEALVEWAWTYFHGEHAGQLLDQ